MGIFFYLYVGDSIWKTYLGDLEKLAIKCQSVVRIGEWYKLGIKNLEFGILGYPYTINSNRPRITSKKIRRHPIGCDAVFMEKFPSG